MASAEVTPCDCAIERYEDAIEKEDVQVEGKVKQYFNMISRIIIDMIGRLVTQK